MNPTLERESPFVCDLTALDAAQRQRYAAVLAQLRQLAEVVVELPDGLAFRHPADAATLLAIAEFISLERRCCPFLDFNLEVVIADGPAWLRLTGPKASKHSCAPSWASTGIKGVADQARPATVRDRRLDRPARAAGGGPGPGLWVDRNRKEMTA